MRKKTTSVKQLFSLLSSLLVKGHIWYQILQMASLALDCLRYEDRRVRARQEGGPVTGSLCLSPDPRSLIGRCLSIPASDWLAHVCTRRDGEYLVIMTM